MSSNRYSGTVTGTHVGGGAPAESLELTDDAPWMKDAACRGTDPDLFFSDTKSRNYPQLKVVKKICGACPVQSDCLTYAIKDAELVGVWGGTTEHERRSIRARACLARFA